MAQPLSPGPSTMRPEELTTLLTPSGVFYPHYTSWRSPFHQSGNRVSRTREPCVHLPCNMKLRTPIPDSQRSTGQDTTTHDVNSMLFKTLSPEVPILDQMPPGRSYLRGPTLPHHLRDFTDRESSTQSFLLLETPNAETPILRTRATCPANDRRLPRNREIAIRDFDVPATLALANPDMPKCDGQ